MNMNSFAGTFASWKSRRGFRSRRILARRRSIAFSSQNANSTIHRIYAINLDRAQERWTVLNRELAWLRDKEGSPLSLIARRFSAVDARYLEGQPPAQVLGVQYTLAEQLSVDPHPQLPIDDFAHAMTIKMSRQEIAVALSHIEVWKQIAASAAPYSLVLEDDVYMTRTCMADLDRIWESVVASEHAGTPIDLLYLSYKETGEATPLPPNTTGIRRPHRGLWQLSGYVLSQGGAAKLLALLPVHGPIDLWINLQFDELDVYIAERSVIEQRAGVASSNSYSVMPALATAGVFQDSSPELAKRRFLKGPIIVTGDPGCGQTAIAEALSVLGYRTISDVDAIPDRDMASLMRGDRRRTFDAYVNIGSIGKKALQSLKSNRHALFILATDTASAQDEHGLSRSSGLTSRRHLEMALDESDPWERLARFLDCDYPTHPWPARADSGQRPVSASRMETTAVNPSGQPLKWDTSPWIINLPSWVGLEIDVRRIKVKSMETEMLGRGGLEDDGSWYRRNDTFPSNEALFRPANVVALPRGGVFLELRREANPVRPLTGAAIAFREQFTYGRFSAEMKASAGSGLITGLFLHRNGPRQEIDIEILGRDTTKMLVNVFYNPGAEGSKLEYGYRGTPVLIDLGFDASEAFHRYEIEWQSSYIQWRVDGTVVYRRSTWDPTPIPDQPMELNVNFWSSSSVDFAGTLDETALPAKSEIRCIEVARTSWL